MSQRPSPEFTELAELLDRCRDKTIRNVSMLSETQLTRQFMERSCLLGLLKHLRDEEQRWFELCFAGNDVPDLPEFTGSFEITEGDTVEGVLERYTRQVATSRAIVRAASLDDRSKNPESKFSLRYIMLQMIAETSEHSGQIMMVGQLL